MSRRGPWAHDAWHGSRRRDALGDWEGMLLAASSLSLEFETLADGPFEGRLNGGVIITARSVELRADGRIGPERLFVRLHADAQRLSIQGPATTATTTAPAQLGGGLALILSRLGLFHLLVRLAHADPPPLGRDAVGRWLRAEQIEELPPADDRPDLADCRGIVLLTRFGTGEVGTGTLWVERAGGAPRERVQGLHLPGAPLAVTELYRSVKLAAPGSWPGQG